MKTNYILFGLLVFLGACTKDNGIQTKKQGFFKVSLGSVKKSAPISNVADTSFNLGEIKSSQRFYFQLGNGGDFAINNITISSNNPSFQFSPSKITSINTVQLGISQSLSLDVIHGTQLNGIGFAQVLKMGLNSSIFTLKGRTFNGHDSLDISESFTVSVDAKLMDCSLFLNNKEIDVTKPFATANGYIYFFQLQSTNDSIKILNTGNVNLTVNYGWVQNVNQLSNQAISLVPNQSQSFPAWKPGVDLFLVLSSNGTIVNSSKFDINSEGKVYFGFH